MIKNIDLIRGTASLNNLNKVDALEAKKKKSKDKIGGCKNAEHVSGSRWRQMICGEP